MSSAKMKCKKIGDYILIKTIGEGTFGKVKLGRHSETQCSVAIKILDKKMILSKEDSLRIHREIAILKKIEHENIVRLYDTVTSNNNIYLIMSLTEGVDLGQYVLQRGRLSEVEAISLFSQLIVAVEYIHSLKVAHRDIKPENILIDKHTAKLTLVDFGLSNSYCDSSLLSTSCGSPCFASPEMITGRPYQGVQSDLWAAGVVLYFMLTGTLPFDDKNIRSLYEKISEAQFSIPEWISASARDLLTKILVSESRRIPLDMVKNHQWLNSEKKEKKSVIFKFLDEEIVNKVKCLNSFQLDKSVTVESIKRDLYLNKRNNVTTAYHLLLKKKSSEKTNESLKSNLTPKNDFSKVSNENDTNVNVLVINNFITNTSNLKNKLIKGDLRKLKDLSLSLNTKTLARSKETQSRNLNGSFKKGETSVLNLQTDFMTTLNMGVNKINNSIYENYRKLKNSKLENSNSKQKYLINSLDSDLSESNVDSKKVETKNSKEEFKFFNFKNLQKKLMENKINTNKLTHLSEINSRNKLSTGHGKSLTLNQRILNNSNSVDLTKNKSFNLREHNLHNSTMAVRDISFNKNLMKRQNISSNFNIEMKKDSNFESKIREIIRSNNSKSIEKAVHAPTQASRLLQTKYKPDFLKSGKSSVVITKSSNKAANKVSFK